MPESTELCGRVLELLVAVVREDALELKYAEEEQEATSADEPWEE